MKNLLIVGMIMLVACQPEKQEQVSEPVEVAPQDPIAGAWSMTEFYVIDNFTNDTLATQNRAQYKVYADGSIMWCQEVPMDSTEWFGFGSYRVEDGKLIENMISGSGSFREVMKQFGNQFTMDLEISEDAFTQINRQDSTTTYEIYSRIK